MRTSRARRITLLAVLVVAASAGLAAAVPVERVLVVTDAGSGESLLVRPVAQNATVVLAYNHSVEKTPVRDVYEVRGTNLQHVRMKFQSYGWGLPSGADVHRSDGWFVFDPGRTYTELFVKPGRVAGHQLHVGDRTYDLVERSSARTIRIRVVGRSVLSAGISVVTNETPLNR